MVRIDKGKGKGKGQGQWVRVLPDGQVEVALPALSNGMSHGGKGGKGGKDDYNPAEAQAIREIKEQLRDPSCEGKVWIQQWAPRFQAELGQLRDFLESRPDKFTVIPGQGKKYTVELVGGGGQRFKGAGGGQRVNGGGGGQRSKGVDGTGTPDDAIQEITQMLQQQGGGGKVWVAHWGKRFEESCGPLRDFLDSQSDKFNVIPGDGRKFEVELIQQGKRKRPASKINGASMVGPTPKKKAKSNGKGDGSSPKSNGNPLIGEAIRTVKEQLSGGGNRVWVPGWGQRFQAELGSLRDFLESRPDKFTVIPGDGSRFSVELA